MCDPVEDFEMSASSTYDGLRKRSLMCMAASQQPLPGRNPNCSGARAVMIDTLLMKSLIFIMRFFVCFEYGPLFVTSANLCQFGTIGNCPSFRWKRS